MPTIDRGGFSSSYRCPGCGLVVEQGEDVKRLATFRAHVDCVVRCRECLEEIHPAFGRPYDTQVYLGQPVHARCKP